MPIAERDQTMRALQRVVPERAGLAVQCTPDGGAVRVETRTLVIGARGVIARPHTTITLPASRSLIAG